MLALAAVAALTATATVSPPQVPASGRRSALLTVARPGMVRVATRGGGGTACTIVDQLRGPFASSGAVGAHDCALDLLLDAGPYELLLDSPGKGTGQVTVEATELPELNAPPPLLERGRPIEQPLPDGKQASFWIRLERREAITVRIAGRTAGAVHVWRAGEWREDLAPLHLEAAPVPGQPIHEWWIEAVLEPGDYLVTAYGTSPKRFTSGAESDLLTVEHGFAPAERALRAILPASGVVAFSLEASAATAVAALEGEARGRVRLSLHELGDSGSRMSREEGGCTIEARAVVPECAARTSRASRHALLLRGPPGTAVLVRWAPRSALAGFVDGEYRETTERLALEPLAPGEYVLGVHDVPADPDAAPLGCALERRPERGGPREIVAWDVPTVAAGRPLQRAFNYAREASIWFEAEARTLLPIEVAISTGGERRSSCVLYRLQGDSAEKLDEDESGRCGISRRLPGGLYELRLRGGGEGVERVRVAERGSGTALPDSGARSGCSFRARIADGWRYALLASRRGAVQVRGVVARRLPAALDLPLPVEVPAGEIFRLPVDARGSLRVASIGAPPAGCHLAIAGAGEWRDGACWLTGAGEDELVLAAKPDAPLVAWIGRPSVPRPPRIAAPHRPAVSELPRLGLDVPARLDFEPGQERALVFDVAEPGLYDVGTEGLLATACALRTPALARLASDRGGGRGRNCLVSAYLRPGRYLVSVRAEAPSRGRAGVVLGRRPARELPPLEADGERFFAVEPNELVVQRLAAPQAGRFEISGAALGAQLRCRLEDDRGWPLQAVPGPCRTTVDLPKGEVVLKELPLTVESMRRNAIARSSPPAVLRGAKPHAIALWTRYRAELGNEGRNEFRFELSAEQDVFVLLTDGMLGRLYREGESRPIDIVAPLDRAPEQAGPGPGEAPEPEAAPEATLEPEAAPEEAGEVDAAPTSEEDAARPRAAAPAPPPRPAAPAVPEGRRLHLASGRYALSAEHSRGDVAVSYEVQVATAGLAPGVERDVEVPARLPLVIPAAGTLRLRTAGDVDVRCRVLDGAGRLVAESSEVGDDWNCGLAEPIAAGEYALVLESEALLPGRSRVSVTMPAPRDVGALQDGRTYDVGTGVLSASIPPAPGDAIVEVALEAPIAFSCAVEDEAGRLAWRASAVKRCEAAVATGGRSWRLRAWTQNGTTGATARVAIRPVSPLERGRIREGGAARARIERPGRYRTGEGIRCLAGALHGLLAPCGPLASLDSGEVLFLAGGGEGRVALEDVPADLDRRPDEVLTLDHAPRLERQVSSRSAVHLVEVRAPAGRRGAPACEIDGGVRAFADGACFAASGATTASIVRLRADVPIEARVRRVGAALPPPARLGPGRHPLDVPEGGGLYRLPDGPARAELLLPPSAWAVLLVGGAAVDLCAPSDALQSCRLEAPRGADVAVFAPAERRAEATIVALASPPPPPELAGVREDAFALPGSAAWRIPSAPAERRLEVDGAARCAVALDDGTRIAACAAALPPGVGGEVRIDHPAGPVRAAVWPASEPLARLGRPVPTGAPRALAEGEAAPLQGDLTDLGIELPAEAVVHVEADAGSCALLSGGALVVLEGRGAGCRLARLLPAGKHRLLVRAFAGAPLSGAARWVAERVELLAEGVGPERWAAPGDARLFRFRVASQGRVGLGIREDAEALECSVADGAGRTVGVGCQQLLGLAPGDYVLAVAAPAGAPPMRFRPVLIGLAGSEMGVPPDYLRDLFGRIGGQP